MNIDSPPARLAADAEVVRFYDRRASRFAKRYDGSPAFQERMAIWQEWIADYVRPDHVVLDVGCGSGIFSFIAARHARQVEGYDASEAMIELSREQARRNNVPNANFHLMRIEQMRANVAQRFDVVLCSSVLEYLEDMPQAIRDIADLMKPGGIFLFSVPNQRSFYRRLEAALYKITGRPKYFGLVRTVPSEVEVERLLASAGLRAERNAPFGDPPISGLMRPLPGGADTLKTLRLYAAVKA